MGFQMPCAACFLKFIFGEKKIKDIFASLLPGPGTASSMVHRRE